jgi:hypothetical protein
MKAQWICCDNCGRPAAHLYNSRGDQQTACLHCDYFVLIREGRVVLWEAPGLDPARVEQFARGVAMAASSLPSATQDKTF